MSKLAEQLSNPIMPMIMDKAFSREEKQASIVSVMDDYVGQLSEAVDGIILTEDSKVEFTPVRVGLEISLEDMEALRAIENYFRFGKHKLSPIAFQVIRRITNQTEPQQPQP